MTAENAVRGRNVREPRPASMRPRPMTAENAAGRRSISVLTIVLQ